MKGKLYLVATPIDEENELHPKAKQTLLTAYAENKEYSLFLVEDMKSGRRRWVHFGLPREAIPELILYNEHTRGEILPQIISQIKRGKNAYLMSDGGLPAFMDPGQELVWTCHQEKIIVDAMPFFNSTLLALALSGFPADQHTFHGYFPKDAELREKKAGEILKQSHAHILLDTPYRLQRLLQDFAKSESLNGPRRKYFLAMDLGSSQQEYMSGGIANLLQHAEAMKKREFVLVIAPTNF